MTTLSDDILTQLEGQGIELPSWAFGNSGTRFRVWTTEGTPRDPREKIADAAGLTLKKVNGDLGMYKGLLSKLAAAKELQKEIFAREKRKTAERLAEKEKAAAKKAADESSA